MRIVYWGVYDTGKPRVRIQLAGLRAAGVTVVECHADVWAGIEDKTRVRHGRDRARLLGRWLRSYPRLLWQYLRAPPHDAVIVGYPGYLDVLVLWPCARLRGARLIWDAFLSLYNTTVEDRALVRAGVLARAVYGWEWLACRAADRLLLDTRAHADYFRRRFNLPVTRLSAVFVGVEPEWFPPCPERPLTAPGGELTVLFYGQFIPLHGVDTIILAARRLADEPVRWVLIGQGQEQEKIRRLLAEAPLPRLTWIPWVPYRELTHWISAADIGLGIFGDTVKAACVIPNKAFQILASRKPLITRDSPAIRELLDPIPPGVRLIPPADPEALAAAIRDSVARPTAIADQDYQRLLAMITPAAIGHRLRDVIAAPLDQPRQR